MNLVLYRRVRAAFRRFERGVLFENERGKRIHSRGRVQTSDFRHRFAPQEGTYRLGDSLLVKGTVKTYSGVPVQEASVKYTVTRRSYTWLRLFNNDETILASGSVMPDEAGEFTVPLLLKERRQRTLSSRTK